MKDGSAWRAQMLRAARQTAEKTQWTIPSRMFGLSPRAIARQTWPSARRRSAWATLAIAASVAVFTLFSFWWTGSDQWTWLIFWIALVVAAGTTLEALVPRQVSARARVASDLLAVREAVVSGAAVDVPLATRQPERFYDIQAPHLQRDQACIYRLDVNTQSGKGKLDLAISLFTLLIAVFPLVAGPGASIVAVFTSDDVLIIFAAAVALFSLVGAVRALAQRRPIHIVATDTGLVARGWGYRRTILWPELRALCRLEVPDLRTTWTSTTARHVVFAALGERTTIAWRSRPKGSLTGAGQPIGEEGEAWRVCGLVSARTGLSLRDITPAVTQVVAAVSVPSSARTQRAAPAFAGASSATTPRPPRAPGMLSFLAVVPLLLTLAATGAGLPRYETRAYTAELAAAQAQTPLLADQLSTPDGRFPVGALPTGTFSFAYGAYQVDNPQGNCCGAYVWAPPVFSTAIVEVTLHQQSSFDLSEAGLVVRADDVSQTMLAFGVTPNGEWRLNRYHLGGDFDPTGGQQIIYDGALVHVGAIHQGADATNRLAVIMRANAYAFFINGQLVGIYHDSSSLSSGHIGFYIDGLAEAVTFSDFAVYPAPPTSPLLPV